MSYRHLIALCLSLIFTALPAFCQQRWEKTFGGTNWDEARSVQQTSDGGYIVAGRTSSFGAGGGDVYLIKTTPQGNAMWTKTYGGMSLDQGSDVNQTSDGGYIITGWTSSFGAGSYDVYLIKVDAQGDTLWTRTFGGANSDGGSCTQQTRDGGYIIVGMTTSFGSGWRDVYLIKTDAQGDTLWTKTYGGLYFDEGYSVQQSQDSGYIIAGVTSSFGAGTPDSTNVYLIKTDPQGDSLWARAYGGMFSEWGFSVRQTQEGGYIIAGYGFSTAAANRDVYIIKTDERGNIVWEKCYGGGDVDQGNSVQVTGDGGYIVAGTTYSFGPPDVYLLKTDAQGNSTWTRRYGGGNRDYGFCVQQTQDGGYVIAGMTRSYGAGYADAYLIKTDKEGSSGVEDEKGQGDRGTRGHGDVVTPNPFTTFASVPGQEKERFILYDISGRKAGTYPGSRIGEGLRAGVYFLRPETQDSKPVRIVKVR